ncbi:MAG: GIY-YIG nuclease family protein [Oscillospiraceae bacterium]|nr:GIY-YIG nuclease family protein [Oscillospiraceae bacterium]
MRTRRIRRRYALVGIYAIINKTNGRVYIGSSSNLISRLAMHERALISGKHPNTEMQQDFDANCHFEFDILSVGRADRRGERTVLSRGERLDLYALESKYIEEYDAIGTGYNQQPISKNLQKQKRPGL